MRWAGLLVLLSAMPVLAAPAALEQVDVAGGAAPVVRLRFSGPPERPTAHPLAADGATPDRVVLDFDGAVLGRRAPRVLAGVADGVLLRVRTGQFTPTTVRVVLDLRAPTPSTVRLRGNAVTITLADAAADPPPAVATTTTRPPTATTRPSTTTSTSSTTTTRPSTTTTTSSSTSTSSSSTTTSRPTSTTSSSASTTSSTTTSTSTSSTSTITRTTSTTSSTALAPVAEAPKPSTAPRLMVIVDAGHGGRDPGAAGIGGVLEKDLTLVIARQLVEKLALRLPVTAVLTRWDDSFVPLSERLPPVDGPPTLFLSLHANASTDPRPNGFEIFYGGDLLRTSATTTPSPRAARFAKSIAQTLRVRLGAVRGHPRPGPFAVLRKNPAPGVLVELGYLTHPGDAARLRDAAHQDRLTDALIDGIAQFLRTDV